MNGLFGSSGSDESSKMAAPSLCPQVYKAKPVYDDINDRLWNFHVRLDTEIYRNEKVAVVGNCEALGNWQHDKCAIMMRDEGEGDTNCWSVDVHIPRDCATKYRYLICAVNPINERIIVRRWETHLTPRSVHEWSEQSNHGANEDVFGNIDGNEKIDRGWLTSETIVQLKFFYAPFKWNKPIKRSQILVKVTPVKLNLANNISGNFEDSLSGDAHDTRDADPEEDAFAFSEVATLNDDDANIMPQPQFGTFCNRDDLVIFHLTVGDFVDTGYLIDFYKSKSRELEGETPVHLGYHYVLPHMFKHSEGIFEAPITCRKRHRPMGTMQFGYLIIKPLESVMDMSVSYLRYWNKKWTGLDVGHRGSGNSFKAKDTFLRENTITSLKNAVDHGADMVEFDVQLSKDMVPVIYHDFMIYVALRKKRDMDENDYMELPMRELTLEQLRILKVYHNEEGRTREPRSFHNEDVDEHQPFPQLADALDVIDPHVGFNVEIKWSQKLIDGCMEEGFEHSIDRNLYLDCILDVLMRHAGNRRIVLSCFDPDMCTMLRFKQNRYPVMFLTIGKSDKYKGYLDPRGNKIETAVLHAHTMQLMGIVAHTEDLLRDPTQINLAKDRNLVLFCWGDDNNSKDTIKRMKELGLHGIIYDRMEVLTSKVEKKSVFCLQTKQSQQELLKIQQMEMEKSWSEKETSQLRSL